MKVEQKGHTIIVKDTKGDLVPFLEKLTDEINSFKNSNLIIDLSISKNILVKDILLFSDIYKLHKKNKKSFVIVTNDFDFNSNTKKISIVPSLQEAHDIIEMEEIERDLGF
ncbi:ribonuclease Z [Flavobacterium sp.]|uniref:ribonuclease Z n=1 Tax=Flavobacterium sp. TaxID=239 RepID=UPI00286DF99E|nr:ribonuclease Z [Flavobacterium sp.]